MTAVIVSVAEVQRHIFGDGVAQDETLLEELTEDVEKTLLRQCGRRLRPFVASADAQTFVLNGTGCSELVLPYPIDDITSIKISADSDFSDPDETLDPDDADVVRWTVGERTIYREDGGSFGADGARRVVQVVYDHAEDKPASAQLAVKVAVATLYRQRGSEDATRESLSGYTRDLSKYTDHPTWQDALSDCWDMTAV